MNLLMQIMKRPGQKKLVSIVGGAAINLVIFHVHYQNIIRKKNFMYTDVFVHLIAVHHIILVKMMIICGKDLVY